MKPTTVYLPIAVEGSKPENDKDVLTNDGIGSYNSKYGTWMDRECHDFISPTFWLEKSERIVMTPEQLREEMIGFGKWVDPSSNISIYNQYINFLEHKRLNRDNNDPKD